MRDVYFRDTVPNEQTWHGRLLSIHEGIDVGDAVPPLPIEAEICKHRVVEKPMVKPFVVSRR